MPLCDEPLQQHRSELTMKLQAAFAEQSVKLVWHARKTPGSICQYKEDGLACVKTSHTVYSRESTQAWYIMPKVLSEVYKLYMHDRKIWKLFQTCGDGRKMTKIFHSKSDFFHFCNPYFFYHTLTDGVGLVDRAFADICDHSLFTCQSR